MFFIRSVKLIQSVFSLVMSLIKKKCGGSHVAEGTAGTYGADGADGIDRTYGAGTLIVVGLFS